jgi:serine protease AprX
MHADPHHLGRGVTLAIVDSGFYPHPDLTEPRNRIRAWVDATVEPVEAYLFAPHEQPRWPGWDKAAGLQWHGTMTSVVAAGSGFASNGRYRGLASEADLALLQVTDRDGRITDSSIVRALRWLWENAQRLRLRVANLSVVGDGPARPGNAIDSAASALVRRGVTVVCASGNDGVRKLLPPATCPDAITVGGLEEQGQMGNLRRAIWHSNYGESTIGALKPELVAPSIWVVAPILPGTKEQRQAEDLFLRRAQGDATVLSAILEEKLVTRHYKLVEGTSFAAPIVASTIACMCEANPCLTPDLVRQCLAQACQFVEGAPAEQQGLGAIDSGQAVAQALRAKGGAMEGYAPSPHVTPQGTVFLLRHGQAKRVEVFGSWNQWRSGWEAWMQDPGIWRANVPAMLPGHYVYKFLLDGETWVDDPANPRKVRDGHGGYNSVLVVV